MDPCITLLLMITQAYLIRGDSGCSVDYNADGSPNIALQLDWCPHAGQSGSTGEHGVIGPKGDQGEVGAPGEIGPPGAIGAPGKDGAPGPQGPTGTPGIPAPSDEIAALKADVLKLKMRNLQIELSGNLYHFGKNKVSWQDARTFCTSLGGDLISKGVRDEQTFRQSFPWSFSGRRGFGLGRRMWKKRVDGCSLMESPRRHPTRIGTQMNRMIPVTVRSPVADLHRW